MQFLQSSAYDAAGCRSRNALDGRRRKRAPDEAGVIRLAESRPEVVTLLRRGLPPGLDELRPA
jgi:hypothetical protein